MLRFLSVIRHESHRYTHAFIEKAQHLRRWISMRTFTRGRLVPRQPRAIKRTTRTELRGERICNVERFHWNISTTLTALHCCNIHNGGCIHKNISATPMALRGENIHHGRYIHWNIFTFCYLFIRMLALNVLQNEYFNAVGVALSKRNPPWIPSLYPCFHRKNSTLTALNLHANVHPG